jgi:hypothetical protein
VQARNDAVRQQFTTNAANARERARLIAAALRELGGVPDVVTPALGRATALAKTVVEQGQSITAALFGDLALEHQLLDRGRYREALAGDVLPVDNYDDLTVSEAEAEVQQLTDPAAFSALLRDEHSKRTRATGN